MTTRDRVALHVNVDHVATLRQARGTAYPDPIAAAVICERAGADGITVHLREDRRHIQDDDVRRLRSLATKRMNLEMAATAEMVAIANEIGPDIVTLVPERRQEQTTEGGLDVVTHRDLVAQAIQDLGAIPVSLFIDPEADQVRMSKELGAHAVELHTGEYAHDESASELARLVAAAEVAAEVGIELAAGHGLTAENVKELVAKLPNLVEVNIGHALVSDAVFVGMAGAVERYLAALARA